MKILLIVFMFISSVCFGVDYNEKYSYKDFSNKTFVDVDVKEFSDTIIKGSCFFQNNDGLNDIAVFPKGIKNVTFENCNLDNVYFKGLDKNIAPIEGTVKLDDGITLINCTSQTIQQNDEGDFVIDKKTKDKIKSLSEVIE